MEDQATRSTAAADASSPPFPPPPGRRSHDTYIVQFPKNQVYRVPPRENALIVEQYRNPAAVRKRRGGICCCCSLQFLLTVALIVIAVVAIVGITLATLFFIFSPKGPTFSVSNVEVKNSMSTRAQYEVLLKAENPNERLRINYESGVVTVMVGKNKVATGKFPTLEQGRGESSEVKVELSGGSNGALAKGDVALKLEMKLWLRVMAAGIKTWVMRSNVVCDVQVSGLGNNTRVLSQYCNANFKRY